ncbi:hypothetical protein B0J13DRAFT_4072 [Dactylonectria estremocensis]|uniref:Uncharacterized protein n=1 Tax=Dactylonectria estremocensis TaxID=1079267 RepID=A0A9P9FI75_9HYPO|nr:hypothetical protein B0J13DRAFT_4072 [Dactylonectria estremocensis]
MTLACVPTQLVNPIVCKARNLFAGGDVGSRIMDARVRIRKIAGRRRSLGPSDPCYLRLPYRSCGRVVYLATRRVTLSWLQIQCAMRARKHVTPIISSAFNVVELSCPLSGYSQPQASIAYFRTRGDLTSAGPRGAYAWPSESGLAPRNKTLRRRITTLRRRLSSLMGKGGKRGRDDIGGYPELLQLVVFWVKSRVGFST